MDRDNILSRLHYLTERLHDGQKGFSYAGNSVEHIELRGWLFEKAQQRLKFANQLNEITASLGGDPEGDGTFLGAVHRQWLAFKAELEDHPDNDILDECLRGEEKAIEDYEEALNSGKFTEDVTVVLNEQLGHIRTSYEELKQLEKRFKQVD